MTRVAHCYTVNLNTNIKDDDMDLKTYYTKLNKSEREALAENINTSPAYLSQLAYGHRKVGIGFFRLIEEATNHQVTRNELRPDIFLPKTQQSA